MIHVINEMVSGFWSLFVGMDFRDFHLAGEERLVAAGKLISQMDGEINWSGIGAALVFGNLPPAALGIEPIALLCLFRFAIELHPGSAARKGEFNVELTAAGDGAIHAILDPGSPTPDVIVLPVNAEGESRDLNRVFRDGWLSFLALRRRRVRPAKEKHEHKDKFDHQLASHLDSLSCAI